MKRSITSNIMALVMVLMSLCAALPTSVYAEIIQDVNGDYLGPVAIVENLATGEKQYFEPEKISVAAPYSYSNSLTESYEVFIPIKTPYDVAPTDNAGGSQTSHGVTATLNIEYEVNSTNEQVKAKRIYGGWTPSDSFYYLSDRYVLLHAGTGSGNQMERYPSTNSFNYSTGWGFNYRYWGDLSPRGISEAHIHISGMSGYDYLITVDVPYS